MNQLFNEKLIIKLLKTSMVTDNSLRMSLSEKDIASCCRKADFQLMSKWLEKGKLIVDESFRKIVDQNMKTIIATSIQKADWSFHFLLVDLFADIKMNCSAFIWLCQKEENCERIQKYIDTKRCETYLVTCIVEVPPFCRDLFIVNMSQLELDEALKETFDKHWDNFQNTDDHDGLIEKLLKAGGKYKPDKCTVGMFERAGSIEKATMILKYDQSIDKKRVFLQVMYKIVTSLSIDMRYRLKNGIYHYRSEFILSRVIYRKLENGYFQRGIDHNSDFDLAIQFLKDNKIKFKTYDRKSFPMQVALAKLGIDLQECEEDLKINDPVLWALPQEFVKFKYFFPETITDKEYWCWEDHLPESLALWIGKYNMLK